jgi:hypothetical protein
MGISMSLVNKFTLRKWLVVIGAIFLFGSCDLLNPVEEPVFDNPRDPQSDNAKAPEATINNLSTGSVNIITNNSLTVEWEPDTSGITENLEYQFRFAEIGQDISDQSWGSWTASTSATFEYLNESVDGGQYTFQVKARAADRTELEQDEPTEATFEVDAIGLGPLFHPRRITNNGDGTYSTEVYVNGLTSDMEVAAMQLQINYPGSNLTVESVDIYDDNSILSKANGDIVTFDDNPRSGELLLNMGVLGGDLSQITGYGPVAKITFSTGNSEASEITFGSETIFSKEDESEISTDNSDSAIIGN